MLKQPYRKSSPSQGDVHVDAILTNISVAYATDQEQYIASKVFPVVPVDKQSDKYYIRTKNDWFRDEAEKRADNTESVGSGYTVSTDSYFADVWAFHQDLGSQLRANADAVLNLERNATRFVTQRLLIRQEVQWVTDFFATGVWGTDITPANLWSDYTLSDPVEDIETGKEAILSVTGYEPNTLVLGYQVGRKLRNHPDIRDRVKVQTGVHNVTNEALASIFGVERVLISKAIKATNKKGAAGTYGFIQGKHALLCYSAPSPGLEIPSAGYTFGWNGLSGGLGTSVAVDSFEIRKTKTLRVEGEMAWDNKVVAADLGYFFNGAVI